MLYIYSSQRKYSSHENSWSTLFWQRHSDCRSVLLTLSSRYLGWIKAIKCHFYQAWTCNVTLLRRSKRCTHENFFSEATNFTPALLELRTGLPSWSPVHSATPVVTILATNMERGTAIAPASWIHPRIQDQGVNKTKGSKHCKSPHVQEKKKFKWYSNFLICHGSFFSANSEETSKHTATARGKLHKMAAGESYLVSSQNFEFKDHGKFQLPSPQLVVS